MKRAPRMKLAPRPGWWWERCGRGYTLIELMIAMSLGLLVSGAVISLYRGQRDAFQRAVDWASITEAGDTALDLIAVQARLAGLAVRADGMPNSPPDSFAMSRLHVSRTRSSPASGGSRRTPPASQPALLPVFGCHAGRPAGPVDAPRCDADSRASDGVQFLHRSDLVSSWTDAHGRATDCLGQALAGHAISAARFFTRVSPSSGEPELYCDSGARRGNAQPVVEGVESMQLSYWLTGVEAAQTQVPAGLWSQVRALEVCLVVHGSAGAVGFPYVDCLGHSVPGLDRRRRQVFRLFVALRNPALQH